MNISILTFCSKVLISSAFFTALSPIDSILATSDISALYAKMPSLTNDQQVLAQETTEEEKTSTRTASFRREKSGFTLYIWQPGGKVSEVIARISIKGKYGEKYHKERFLGDYKYQIKQKAKFVNGFKFGDRITVRLYDTKNNFIGYTEFACLPKHTTVNLILSANPTENPVVRVFYGVDNNEDDIVDTDSPANFDYFTQLNNQKVTFLTNSKNINITQYQAAGFSNVAQTSVYPTTFSEGEFAVAGKTISVYDNKLAPAIISIPGSLVKLNQLGNNATFQLHELLSKYRSVGIAKGIRVNFSDIPQDYWAKDYIAELAAMEIIDGYPDGTFRPNAPVTRAQLASLLQKIFIKTKVRKAINFRDIPQNYWAHDAIRETYEMGFFTVVNSKNFNPNQKLKRLDVLITLAKGLNYKISGSTQDILSIYKDAATIRSEHRGFIAALTQNGVIVNYPNIKLLNGSKQATRAEVCALLYRVMASSGEVSDFASKYTIKPVAKSD